MQRVVLVESDPALREWCRLHLEADQLTVLAFDDVRSALEAARVEPPDLLIVATDLQAAGAFALVSALRSALRTALIPVLFLVPSHDAEALAHALSIEPNGTVTKPLTRAVLLKTVGSLLSTVNQVSTGRDGARTGTSRSVEQAREPATSAGGTGLLLDVREATVLVVVLRNFVSLARAVSAKALDGLLRRFMSHAAGAIAEQGGWIVRADAANLVVLFEDSPKTGRPHSTRAIESALRILVAARRAKSEAGSGPPDVAFPDLSVGCGVHTGEVVIARLAGAGHLANTIAGQTAELAHRLDGRAKGLGWSVAASESAAMATGALFQFGRRASLKDTNHDVTLSISEVLGFNPGFAKPGELPAMAEVREAVLANTMLAKLAGDIDPFTADKTIVVGVNRPVESETLPEFPDRRVNGRIAQGRYASTYAAVHLPTNREEVVKMVRSRVLPPRFIDSYLEEYRKLSKLEQRNVVNVYEVGETRDGGYVALESLPGGELQEAIRRKLSIGHALSCLAEMCLALDAVHGVGIVHGALRAEHFRFRPDRVLALADFNVTDRVCDSVGLAQPVASSIHRRRQPRTTTLSGVRRDFRAVGRIFHAMLTGALSLLSEPDDESLTGKTFDATRLPLPLSPLQPCLDGLLGTGPGPQVERAEDVLVELLALKDVFPFDIRQADADGAPHARERTGR